nr:MAG TPA: hypothetical protein [Caudoviricetes sp.]
MASSAATCGKVSSCFFGSKCRTMWAIHGETCKKSRCCPTKPS